MGLVFAKPSSDFDAPVSKVRSIQKEKDTVLQGMTSDLGGGVVAGVEVSVDNGQIWHPADLSDDGKSFAYYVSGNPDINMNEVKSRAVDDSGNLEQ